jgi:hypothetical protein
MGVVGHQVLVWFGDTSDKSDSVSQVVLEIDLGRVWTDQLLILLERRGQRQSVLAKGEEQGRQAPAMCPMCQQLQLRAADFQSDASSNGHHWSLVHPRQRFMGRAYRLRSSEAAEEGATYAVGREMCVTS